MITFHEIQKPVHVPVDIDALFPDEANLACNGRGDRNLYDIRVIHRRGFIEKSAGEVFADEIKNREELARVNDDVRNFL